LAALRAGRFAGFKFRRQHPVRGILSGLLLRGCASIGGIDGFQHGIRPKGARRKRVKSFWLEKASSNCGFGTISGGENRKAYCLKYG